MLSAKAASSSGTYGFNLGVELNVDLQRNSQYSHSEISRGSRIQAASIRIESGGDTRIVGSDLAAESGIGIKAENLDIQAGRNRNSGNERGGSEHLSIAYDLYGGSSGKDFASAAAGSASASLDQSSNQRHYDSLHHRNSQLQAASIRIDTSGTTRIHGATLHGTDGVDIHAATLDVASVQDSEQESHSNRGMGINGSLGGSVSGGSLGTGHGRSDSRKTLLTRITGGQVHISVEGDTLLTGAIIAGVDANGQDNGQLTLDTGTLTARSLIDSRTTRNTGTDLGLGSTARIDQHNERINERSKTPATIGSGRITLGDSAGSDTRMLNRDTDATRLDLYAVESRRNLNGELDIRLLTEQGRDRIAEDLLKAGMIANSIELILTTKRVTVADFFHETDKANQTYEAVKTEIRNDPKLAQALQNPDLTPEQKEQMLDQITGAVLVKLGYATHNNILIATDEPGQNGQPVAGFYSTEDSDAYINDQHIGDTEGLVTVAGHEASHAMDQQDGIDINNPDNRQDNNLYADNIGQNLASYTDMALDISGYDDGMATSNSHSGNDSQYVHENNQSFSELDKTQGDNRLTDEQIKAAAEALSHCNSTACTTFTQVKFGTISAVQGAAELTGITVGAVNQVIEDISGIINQIDTLIEDPAKAEAVAGQLDATLQRTREIIDGSPVTEQEMEQLTQIVQGAVNAIETAAEDFQKLDGEGLAASFGEGKKTGAVVAGMVGLGKLDRFLRNLDKTAAAKRAGNAPDFVVTPGGTAFPVPQGARGPTPVVNPGGKTTGAAFTGGKGGSNGQVDTMRIMNSTPPRGKSPGYPNGYIKYENKDGQGVDPYTGRTLSNKNSHFPIE